MRLYNIPLGFKMYLDIDESRDMKRRRQGNYEKWMINLIEEKMDPKGIFIDGGGNKGYHSLFVASRFPQSKIFTFEPELENCQWIRESIIKNGFENITLIEGALSNKKGNGILFLGEKSGLHSLHKWRRSTDKTQRTDITTLDEIFKDMDEISFIKLDVEGGEYNILKGGKETLLKTKNLVMEYEGSLMELQGLILDDFFNILSESGIFNLNIRGDKSKNTFKRGHIIASR